MKTKYKKSESGILLPTQGTGLIHGVNQGPIVMAACAKFAAGVLADCDTKPVAGTETEIYLCNREDIASLTYDVANNLIVEAITMTGVTLWYKFKGIKQSNSPTVKMNKTKYLNNWIHGLDFLVFANDGATKEIIMDLSNSEICAIVQNKWKGTAGNMAYELYGFGAGLVMTAAERNPNDAETAGAWKLTFGPDEGQFEDNVPLTVYDTDLATTKSLVEALTV